MNHFFSNTKHRTHLFISLLIILGFIASAMVTYFNYSKIIREDIQNITKLSSANIYSEINNELIKPIFVSLTMANDSFLKEWLSEEAKEQANVESLQRYLSDLQVKYGYNSVFLISEHTNNYYHYKGIHKTISTDDTHDTWYYQFIESGKSYDLDVDVDEAASNLLTVFVNCRIVDSNNQLLGVAGVGLEIGEVQKILGMFEDTYGLEAFLIDPDGLIQVHTNNQLIESYNVSEDQMIRSFMNDIISNQTTLKTYRYKENGIDGYLITRYIDELEWYLMVKKDTSVLRHSFASQITKELLILMLVIFGVVFISNQLIKRHHETLVQISKTDQLTQLLNRRGFDLLLSETFNDTKYRNDPFSVFIFDIDHFKSINDRYGHLFGDGVIQQVVDFFNIVLSNQARLARWGGDEFVGIIHEDLPTAQKQLESLITLINEEPQFKEKHITISIGLTQSKLLDTPDIIMARADKALYRSKNNGRNQLTTV